MRLIDADTLEPDSEWNDYYDGFMSYSQSQISAAPTIEAEAVVRCKDCMYLLKDNADQKTHLCMQNRYTRRNVNLNDFCSYGKKTN